VPSAAQCDDRERKIERHSPQVPSPALPSLNAWLGRACEMAGSASVRSLDSGAMHDLTELTAAFTACAPGGANRGFLHGLPLFQRLGQAIR
jgi:hypothetical protein